MFFISVSPRAAAARAKAAVRHLAPTGLAAAGVTAAAATVAAAASLPASPVPGRLAAGGTAVVSGQKVTSWARVAANGSVTEVGITLPLGVAQNPPSQPGTGPLGAVAVIPFPREARESTYFDHLELHWNPHGHPPACCFGVPHFDIHFYGVPEALVRQVAPPDTAPPAAERLPAGYAYPGINECVPEMGVHAMRPGDLLPNGKFTAVMVAGFYKGRMTFIEPMVTRKKLLEKRSFSLDVPRPAQLGRATQYPTRFSAAYDPAAKVYRLVFSGFTARDK